MDHRAAASWPKPGPRPWTQDLGHVLDQSLDHDLDQSLDNGLDQSPRRGPLLGPRPGPSSGPAWSRRLGRAGPARRTTRRPATASTTRMATGADLHIRLAQRRRVGVWTGRPGCVADPRAGRWSRRPRYEWGLFQCLVQRADQRYGPGPEHGPSAPGPRDLDPRRAGPWCLVQLVGRHGPAMPDQDRTAKATVQGRRPRRSRARLRIRRGRS